jgi:hypothetical protein
VATAAIQHVLDGGKIVGMTEPEHVADDDSTLTLVVDEEAQQTARRMRQEHAADE